jgi:hypothetical protein
MKQLTHRILLFAALLVCYTVYSQPDWTVIKSNATFVVADTSYGMPYVQPINVGGWEDGLFITRDGKHLFSTYIPIDLLSWYNDFILNPACFNFNPYYRPPLLGIDTLTNPYSCSNYIQSDIITSSRADTSQPFNAWQSSGLAMPVTMEGGSQGVLKNADTFDLFVFTRDLGDAQHTDIYFMKDVPVNPNQTSAVAILSSAGQEDNPHIERLNDSSLILFFDRDRYIYYSKSTDNGANWQPPVLITNVLNDQAPYDVQPHLWNDGTDWWVYFCADNSNSGKRAIYKSKQQTAGDWNSWGPKELVIEGGSITGGSGIIAGVGEPTLTQWGDLSFVVIYGDLTSGDTTDVFDCDPWFLPRKNSPLSTISSKTPSANKKLLISPNPANAFALLSFSNPANEQYRVNVSDISGKKIISEEWLTGSQYRLNTNKLEKGIYFVELLFNDKSYNSRLVIE